MAIDALAHGEEGLSGAAHFGGAIGLEVRHIAAFAEGVGGARQPFDRAHLVAQEQDRDGQQDQRRQCHQQNEDVGARHRDPVARHHGMQHAVMHFDADQKFLFAGQGRNHEVALLADLLSDDFIERLVDGAVVDMGRWRNMYAGLETQLVIELPGGHIAIFFAPGTLAGVFLGDQ